jgi:glycosyltransferase involved in cell wall biosynthesis
METKRDTANLTAPKAFENEMPGKGLTVVVVTDSARLDGGITQVAVQSVVGLVNLGYCVHYFAGEGPADPLLTNLLPPSQIHIQETLSLAKDPNPLRAAINGIANRRCGEALRRILARLPRGRTIVHIHGWCKNLSPRIAIDAQRSGHPVVQTLHEYFLVCPNGALYDFRAGEICHRKPVGLSCAVCNCDSRKYSHKLWRLTRGAYQRFILGMPRKDVVYIANSPLTRRVFSRFIPPASTVFDLYNPVSIQRGPRATPEQQKPYLFVGRFSREKGVLHLAQALGELGLPAVFVGDGHLREKMQALAPSAEFPGWQTNEQVAQWMRRSRALVFPSTWYETLGLVTVEAAAVGLPALISDCTAAVDFFPDGVSALHCHHGSIPHLKEKLRQLQDDNLVQRLSKTAYENYWKDPWTIERHGRGLSKIYNQYLATPSPV